MDDVEFTAADDGQWKQYQALATRAYGETVPDIALLGAHGDRRVALRGSRVVAGGLGVVVPQWFGGRAVPAASLGCGAVAPEERGGRLAGQLMAQRVRAVREQGAVLATLWTASSRYVRRLGWEAPAQVLSWTVPTAALRREQAATDTLEITHGDSGALAGLRERLAGQWNGPWQRPTWWAAWQQQAHPDVATYAFAPPGREATGALAVAVRRAPGGRELVVYDFWAADAATSDGMLAFLGGHHGRIPSVLFERTALPPGPLLPQRLARIGEARARSWHPWMLRVLDPVRAVELRGWPPHLDDELVLDIDHGHAAADADAGGEAAGEAGRRFTLAIGGGRARLDPGGPRGRAADVTLSGGQFAVWYAGGYRSTAAAALAGIRGNADALARLLAATTDREAWLADYF
ncbi:GNAT family N-acetyltransferase [Streptomyces sp. NPDC001941]|uniref:GNAT family N-acetyltransferase n=1 Tax=Streptomyces sp. NPDC001941 TaxID=3154659 RepID=UPI0033323FC9